MTGGRSGTEDGVTGGSFGFGGSTSICAALATGGALGTAGSTSAKLVATSITAGYFHTCALLSDGTIQCWGTNGAGELGIDPGAVACGAAPVLVSGVGIANAVSAGDCSNCALLSTGTIKCWGNNYDGALGNGTTTAIIPTPVSVSGVTSAVAVTAGDSHGCSLLNSGRIQCWGANRYGELGNNTSTMSSTPVDVLGITNAVAITAGGGVNGAHTCAVLNGGSVLCWGYNGDGELGNGTNADSWTPVEVSGITNAVAVAAGDSHTCIVLSGAVQCWGRNDNGQLGNGTTTSSAVPVSVSGITDAIYIAGGDAHTCAVLSSGAIQCWGLNDNGQLGNGTATYYDSPQGISTPVLVSGISNAIAVAAGSDHTCAVLSSGSVQCWGNNNYGKLGNGTLAGSNVPVTVSGF